MSLISSLTSVPCYDMAGAHRVSFADLPENVMQEIFTNVPFEGNYRLVCRSFAEYVSRVSGARLARSICALDRRTGLMTKLGFKIPRGTSLDDSRIVLKSLYQAIRPVSFVLEEVLQQYQDMLQEIRINGEISMKRVFTMQLTNTGRQHTARMKRLFKAVTDPLDRARGSLSHMQRSIGTDVLRGAVPSLSIGEVALRNPDDVRKILHFLVEERKPRSRHYKCSIAEAWACFPFDPMV